MHSHARTPMAPLEAVCNDMEQLAVVGREIVSAVESGDSRQVIAAVGKSRRISAELQQSHQRLQSAPLAASPGDFELLRRLRAANDGATFAQQVIRAWFERELPPPAELRQTPDGLIMLADQLLGPTWDIHRDVFVLVGGGADVAAALVALGQRRIVVLRPTTGVQYPPTVLVAGDLPEFRAGVALYGMAPPTRMEIVFDDEDLAAADQELLETQVKNELDALTASARVMAEFGPTWLRQGIANLPVLAECPAVGRLQGAYEGQAAVIVSPGPSLAGNIDHLHSVAGKALIIASSHAVRSLSRAGIVPDVVVIVDMQDLLYHLDNFDLSKLGALIVGATVHPAVARISGPAVFVAGANNPFERWLGDAFSEPINLGCGGSVSHLALSFAAAAGIRRVALVGQDLSFPEGRVYVDSCDDGETTATLSSDGGSLTLGGWSAGYAGLASVGGAHQSEAMTAVRVVGYYGDEVVTSSMFHFFLRWFEEAARVLDDVQIFNCTEGGVAIAGTHQMPLQEFADSLPDEPVELRAPLRAAATIDKLAQKRSVIAAVEQLRDAVAACVELAEQDPETTDPAVTQAITDCFPFAMLGVSDGPGVRLRGPELHRSLASAATNLRKLCR